MFFDVPEGLNIECSFDEVFLACSNASQKLDLLKEAIHQEVYFEEVQLERHLQWTFTTALANPKCKRIVIECLNVMRILLKKAKEAKFNFKLPLRPAEERLESILKEANEYIGQADVETRNTLLKLILRSSGHYDSQYEIEFPGDDYEAMCLALIKAALLCNRCPEWVYEQAHGDLLPSGQIYNLLSLYCLKHLESTVGIDWPCLFNRFAAVLKLPKDKAQVPGIVPRSLPCKYDDVANGIIDEQIKPGRILGRLLVHADEAFAKYFLSSALVFCHPSSAGEYSEGLVELANAYVVECFRKKRSISLEIAACIQELVENALQLKKPYVVKLAAKTLRTLLYVSGNVEKIEKIFADVGQSLLTIDEPTRLYSRLELLANIMRNLVERDVTGLDEVMIQISGMLDVNDSIKSSLAMDCSLAYVLLVRPDALEGFMAALLENVWDYLVLVSEGEEVLNSTGVHSMLHPLVTIGIGRMHRKEFVMDLILAKLKEDHFKSKALARMMELCAHKVDKDYRISVLKEAWKELEKFDGQANVKDMALKRLEHLLTLFSHSIVNAECVKECEDEMKEVLRKAADQPSPAIGFLISQFLKETFTQALPLKFTSQASGSFLNFAEASPHYKKPSIESIQLLFDVLNDFNIGSRTKTHVTIWKGIVQAWLVVCCSAKMVGIPCMELSYLEQSISFRNEDTAEILESRIGIIGDLYTFRHVPVQDINSWMFGLRLYAELFTLHPLDMCYPPEIHCRRLELAYMARLFYSPLFSEKGIDLMSYVLCGYEFVSGFAVGVCGTLIHYHPRRFMPILCENVKMNDLDEKQITGMLQFLDRTEFLKRIFYYSNEQGVANVLEKVNGLKVADYGNDLRMYLNICRSFLDGWHRFDKETNIQLIWEKGKEREDREGTITQRYSNLCLTLPFAEKSPKAYSKWICEYLKEEAFGMNFIALDFMNKYLLSELDCGVAGQVFEMRCLKNEEDCKFEHGYALFYRRVAGFRPEGKKASRKSERIAMLEIYISQSFGDALERVVELVEELGYDGLEASTSAMNYVSKYSPQHRVKMVELLKVRLQSVLNDQKRAVLMTCLYALLLPTFEKGVDIQSCISTNGNENEVMQNAIGMLLSLSPSKATKSPDSSLLLLLPTLSFKSVFYRKMRCYELLCENLKTLISGCYAKEETLALKCRLTLDFLCTRVITRDLFVQVCDTLLASLESFSMQQKKIAMSCLRKLVKRNYLLLTDEYSTRLEAVCVDLVKQNCEEAFELLSVLCFFRKFPFYDGNSVEPIVALALIQAAGYRFPEWLPECFERVGNGLKQYNGLKQRVLMRWKQLRQSTWEEDRFKLNEEQLQVFHELAPSYIV